MMDSECPSDGYQERGGRLSSAQENFPLSHSFLSTTASLLSMHPNLSTALTMSIFFTLFATSAWAGEHLLSK